MRIITGLQPSGKLHVGNYFGAMEPAVRMQESGESFYFLADYHAMSTVHDANALRENCSNLATDFLAVGLDPEKCVFFRQSAVPEVNELAWILSTVCPMGLLERCHSYKDKIAKGFSPSNALFTYPVLMAADILMYDSDLVPVGKDQKQHLEVTRDLAGKMNEQFGEGTCKLPDALIAESTAIVPGLDGQKMSKSYNNTLPIFGEEKAVRKLIMRIPTDSTPWKIPNRRKVPSSCSFTNSLPPRRVMKIWCAVSRTGDAAMETSKSASLTLTGNTSGPRANAGRNWKPIRTMCAGRWKKAPARRARRPL